MNPPQIRRARPAEAKLLTALVLRSKAYWGYSKAFMDACVAELTIHPDYIELEHVFVIENRPGAIAGMYALESKPEPNRGAVELDLLYVDTDQMGNGYGRMLIDHAIEQAKETGASVIVIQADPGAEPFYKKCGAVKTGERESGSIPGRFLPVMEISLV